MRAAFFILSFILSIPFAGIAGNIPFTDTTNKPGGPRDKVQYGIASYYHSKFNGRKTASGDIYDEKKFTAAHNGLPLRTWVKITNLSNNRSVVVRINDRMHPKNKRLVDLSRAAASRLGYIGKGLVRVKLEVLGKKRPKLPN